MWWVESRDFAKRPIMYVMAPLANKELSRPNVKSSKLRAPSVNEDTRAWTQGATGEKKKWKCLSWRFRDLGKSQKQELSCWEQLPSFHCYPPCPL